METTDQGAVQEPDAHIIEKADMPAPIVIIGKPARYGNKTYGVVSFTPLGKFSERLLSIIQRADKKRGGAIGLAAHILETLAARSADEDLNFAFETLIEEAFEDDCLTDKLKKILERLQCELRRREMAGSNGHGRQA